MVKNKYSYYEVYITCLRAFVGMGFPFGADEDAADIISWLELHKLNGVKQLAKLSKKIDNKYNGKVDIAFFKSKKIINFNEGDLLMKGPGLFDYLSYKTKKNKILKIDIEQCYNPQFSIPLALKISKENININLIWKEKKNNVIVNVFNNKVAIYNLKSVQDMKENKLTIELSKKNKKFKTKKLIQNIDNNLEQKRLKAGLTPNKKDWIVISKFANRTFVPDSDLSRNRGAGGGDDND